MGHPRFGVDQCRQQTLQKFHLVEHGGIQQQTLVLGRHLFSNQLDLWQAVQSIHEEHHRQWC